MKAKFYLLIFSMLFGVCLFGQYGPSPRGITIETDSDEVRTDSSTSTEEMVKGPVYDTAIFDSTARIPFKIYENRGDEMLHSWICLGIPKSPHVYLGVGIYHFDKAGMTDVQIGWYPLIYPNVWESYYSFERMFFLKKKSKEVQIPICIYEDGINGLRTHYNYSTTLRRDKFYGISSGVAFEGWLNPKGDPVEMYHTVDNNGEEHSIKLIEYKQVNVHVGFSRMRCKNVEYAAPMKHRRKKICHGSTMSRITIGGAYFPVNKLSMEIDSGYVVDFMTRALQPDFAFYFSWEGRVAFQNMKREWGLHANLIFLAPTWNRMVPEYNFAINNSWGVYVSLEGKNPKYKRLSCSNANF